MQPQNEEMHPQNEIFCQANKQSFGLYGGKRHRATANVGSNPILKLFFTNETNTLLCTDRSDQRIENQCCRLLFLLLIQQLTSCTLSWFLVQP